MRNNWLKVKFMLAVLFSENIIKDLCQKFPMLGQPFKA